MPTLLICQVLLVDRLGRRTLMLAGLAGMFLSYGMITIAYALQVNYTVYYVRRQEILINKIIYL